jgi:small subunit ribosomal protein S7
MPRRKRELSRREIAPDHRYNSEVIERFINVIMERGKKSTARSIVYGAMDIIAGKASGDKAKTLEMFNKAYNNVIPAVEVRPRRVGGSVYQIPTEVRADRARALALRWLKQAAQERPGKTMSIRLAQELLDAIEGRGAAVKKKSDVHRMAESNRAFSHYAW